MLLLISLMGSSLLGYLLVADWQMMSWGARALLGFGIVAVVACGIWDETMRQRRPW